MKLKVIFILFLFFPLFISVNAQIPLIIQNLNAINRDVQYISDSTLVIVGDDGKIIRTDNGAKSWRWQECYRRANLKKLHFLNEQIGYVVGDSGLVLHTNDSGEHWSEQYLSASSLNGVYTLSATAAIAVGNKGSIFQTQNAGKAWIKVYYDTSFNLTDVQFVNQDFGTAVGSNGTILRTLDGGATWKQLYSEPLLELTRVKFVNQQYGYAVGGSIRYVQDTILYYSLRILHTNNGGQSWALQGDTTAINIVLGIAALDTLNAVICGNGCSLFHTNKSGYAWEKDKLDFSAFLPEISRPIYLYLNSVSFLNPKHGVLVGMENIIAFTKDSAKTWELSSYAKITEFTVRDKTVSDIEFTNNDNGVVLTDAGVIWQTTDAGVTSIRRYPLISDKVITRESSWAGVHFKSKSDGIAIGVDPAGSTGKLTVRTVDGGKTWTRNDELQASRMSFPTTLRGYLGGAKKDAKRTDDGGITWTSMNYQGWTAKCHPFISADTGFYTSSQNKATDDTVHNPSGYISITKIYRTSDGGITFNEVLADSSGGFFNSVSARDENVVFGGGGLQGKIARSDDCGLTWKWLPLPTINEITCIYFHNSRLGFMTDLNNNLLITTDGGDSWQLYLLPFFKSYEGEPNTNFFNNIKRGSNDSTFYLMGINRFARCIIPRSILNKVEESHLSEGTFNPYFYITTTPIPAVSSMQIKLYGLYSVKGKPLTVKVYSMLGVEVADFSQQANTANTGSISTFDADVSSLTNGVYVLQYSAGGYSKSGLLVVAK